MRTALTRLSLAGAALALAASLGAWALAGGRLFNPGALSAAAGRPLGGVRSHAQLAGKCDACHAAPWSAPGMDARCLACHTDIQAALRDTTSLHGALTDAAACRACHTEHRGPAGALTRFAGAGEAHEKFGFALAAHRTTADRREFACADCHPRASFAFRRERCEACHRDYQPDFVTRHIARWGADCLACHDGTDRFTRGRFDHAAAGFALDGAHASADCLACHRGAGTLAALKAAPTACAACHAQDDRHRGSMGQACGACHGSASWEGARFDHAAFPVSHGSRDPVACSVCHPQANQYAVYTCYGCHEHAPGRIEAKHVREGISDFRDCVRCHRGGSEHGEGEGGEHEGRRRGGEREHDD